MYDNLTLVTVPYHLGVFGDGIGAGPLVVEKVCETIPVRTDVTGSQIADIIAVNREQALVLRRELSDTNKRIVVVSGNCNAVLGTLCALNNADTAVIWFDAHPDLNTRDTSQTGYLDGKPLAAALQIGLPELAVGVGAPALRPDKLLLVSARDIDPGEAAVIAENHISVIDVQAKPRSLQTELEQLVDLAEQAYVHIDLDVFAPELVPGTPYQVPAGLDLEHVSLDLEQIVRVIDIPIVGITYYDPALDSEEQTLVHLMKLLAIIDHLPHDL